MIGMHAKIVKLFNKITCPRHAVMLNRRLEIYELSVEQPTANAIFSSLNPHDADYG